MSREMTPAEIKAACEAHWNSPAFAKGCEGARAIWSIGADGIEAKAGATIRIPAGPGAARFYRETARHWGPPAPAHYKESAALYCPKTTRARYRERFPNNWRALVAGYGKVDSLSLRSEKYMEALQAPSLPGLVSAEIAREPSPIAPTVDLGTMPAEYLEAAAAPILEDVARELAEYVANVRADHEADAAREAAARAPEIAPPAPGHETPAAPAKPASDRRKPRARRSRDMAPPTIWQARALGLVAAPNKKPRAAARHAWRG